MSYMIAPEFRRNSRLISESESEAKPKSKVLRYHTSEQAAYRLLRLFYKSQSALIPLFLLSNRESLCWIRSWFWVQT